MSTLIKLKNSSISGKAPSSSDLVYGELALNFNDGRLYFKNTANNVEYFEKSTFGADFTALLSNLDAGLVTDSSISNELDLELVTGSTSQAYDMGFIAVSGYISPTQFILPNYTANNLPTSSLSGQMIMVIDDVGGPVPAFSDGTDWRRVTDRQIIS